MATIIRTMMKLCHRERNVSVRFHPQNQRRPFNGAIFLTLASIENGQMCHGFTGPRSSKSWKIHFRSDFWNFFSTWLVDRDAARCTLCSRYEFRFSNKEFRSPRIPFDSAGNAAGIVSLVSLSTRYDDRLANELATGISTSVSRWFHRQFVISRPIPDEFLSDSLIVVRICFHSSRFSFLFK